MTPDVLIVWGHNVPRRPPVYPSQRVLRLTNHDVDDPEEFLRGLEHYLEPGQTVGLDVPEGTHNSQPKKFARLLHGINLARCNVQSRHNVAKLRSQLVVRNVIRNLGQLPGAELLDLDAQPLAGQTAFIVGAGPSLESNYTHLEEALATGCVIAVNSSWGYLLDKGIEPHAVVCIESVDASDQMRPAADTGETFQCVALEAHPDNLDDQVFVAQAPAWGRVSRALGVRPLPYTGNVTAAAFSLALNWGATKIVLVGQDLAYADDGRIYAGDSRRAEFNPDDKSILLPHRPESDLRYKRAGLPPPGREHRMDLARSWYFAHPPAISTHTLSSFRMWLERAAERTPKDVTLLNATEGGAHIEGFASVWLRDMVTPGTRLDFRFPARAVTRDEAARLLRGIHFSALAVHASAAGALEESEHARAHWQKMVRAACRDAPLVECYAVPGLDKAMSTHTSMRPRSRAIYEALRDAGKDVSQLAQEALCQVS